MDTTHKVLHERILCVLASKLDNATRSLGSLVETKIAKGRTGDQIIVAVKPLKYAIKKERLDRTIDALEAWQQMFDPSWFLLWRMHGNGTTSTMTISPIASQISRSIPSVAVIQDDVREASTAVGSTTRPPALSLPAKALLDMDISMIPLSTAKLARSVRSDRVINYILDHIDTSDPSYNQTMKKNVRDLAHRLQHDEPNTFGLLSCKGFVAERSDPHSESLTLIFRTPDLCKPQSLRAQLLNSRKPESLSERFLVAQGVAKSISYVHVFGFVHKNVRPETIFRFETQGQEDPSIFLVGFGEFRQEDGRTRRRGDDAVERNLYRHPSRQGTVIGQDFVMQHDIYSLGVCLLEIGLWQSFISYDVQVQNASLSPVIGISSDASQKEAASFLLTSAKTNLVRLARHELRQSMGTQYSEIVETCLTCLDPDNTFGDQREFEDEYGIRVGVRYIEKILHRLGGLSV